MKVVRTYPPVTGDMWLDIVRVEPGRYSVHAIGNHQNPIADGFLLQSYAEEWVTAVQDGQRAEQRTSHANECLQQALETLRSVSCK